MAKKELTRARLLSAAFQLISDQGYDETTVDQIAAMASVSTMTFFRYFPSKDLLVLDDPYDPVIVEAIARQPNNLPAFERARRGLLAAWSGLREAELEEQRARVRIIAATPQLRAKVWERNLITRHAIVEALTQDGSDHLNAEAAAGACLGALEAALLDWGRSDDGTLGDRVVRALGSLRTAGGESNE